MSKSKETFLKREKEKKRLQKKTEKEARRQERQSHSLSGRPLDEMMVYVDENGNLSETPPEPVKQQAGALNKDISNSFPNTANRPSYNNHRGA